MLDFELRSLQGHQIGMFAYYPLPTRSGTLLFFSPIKPLPRTNSVRAENQARTGHPDLGKVVLYQMSYFRFLAVPAGLEPATSAVTGRRCEPTLLRDQGSNKI